MSRLARSDSGASTVEYGLLVALIAALSVVAVVALGAVLGEVFVKTCHDVVSNSATRPGNCTP